MTSRHFWQQRQYCASLPAPGDDRSARRAWLRNAMAAMDPDVFPLIVGMFAGPESIPTDLVEAGVSTSLASGLAVT